MGNSFRNQPLPTQYGPLKTPVREDSLQVGLLFAFGIIAFSFILIIPGIRGCERVWSTIRVFFTLWVGTVLLVCNFGSWYSDTICTRAQYKAHTTPNSLQLIQATVGISIGLRGFNVTLKERENGCDGFEDYIRPFPDEEINYEESFRWAPSWRQGRQDFGEFGAQLFQEYRAAKYRGMPYPITWVAESFLLDGEQFRWYRKFRTAGWYSHIFLWAGFATYLLSIVLFINNVFHGAVYMLITGLLLLLAVLNYGVLIQNDPPLRIIFPDATLRPKFNYSFYLTLVTGAVTSILACVILLVDFIYPRRTAEFFHHSVIDDDASYEEDVEEERELAQQEVKRTGSNRGVEGKIRRKRTANHLRESIRNSIRNSRSNMGRSDVLPRQKSSVSLIGIPEADDSAPNSPHEERLTKEEVVEVVVVKPTKNEVAVRPAEEEAVEVRLTGEVVVVDVEVRPTEKEVVEVRPTEKEVVEVRPTEKEVVVRPTEKEVVVRPTEKEVVEVRPTEKEMVEVRLTEEEVVKGRPTEAEVVEGRPTEAEVVEVVESRPTETEVVEGRPTEVEVVESRPTETEVVEGKPTKEEAVEARRAVDVMAVSEIEIEMVTLHCSPETD